MAKRRKRGIFDPDYRRQGWNQSRFAPRNSPVNITQLSGLIAILICSPLIYLFYKTPNMTNMVIAGGALLVVWLLTAMFIVKREWERIQSILDKQELQDGFDTTATNRRQLNKSLDLDMLSPSDFEHEVAWLLNTLSNFKAVVVGGSGDDGVDIEIYKDGRLVGIAQCKRYDSNRVLSPAHIRELAGAKQATNTRLAYLFTTARCTNKSHRTAARLGIKVFESDQIEKMREKATRKTMRNPEAQYPS